MTRTTARLAHTTALISLTFAGAASAQDITVWSGYPELAPFYDHVAEGMKADWPDLNVTVEAIALREHEKRLALGLASGLDGATVIELSGSTASRYVENDLIPAAPDDVAAFVADPANFGQFFVDSASRDGTVYGIPLMRGQGSLFYNTDMFAAAGLEGPPKTIEEFSDYAAKLTQRDAGGKATVSGWSLRLSGGGQGIAEKFWINLFQYGGNLIVSDGNGKYKADYANEAGVKALGQYLDLIAQGAVSVEMPADAEAFERGQTAMFIRESWVIGDIAAKAPDLPYATAPLPVGSIALPTNLYVAGGEEEATAAAWAFAQAANQPDNLVWMLANVGWLPNRSGVDYSSVTGDTPAFAAFVDYPEGYQFFTLPAIGPVEEVLTRVAAQLEAAFTDPGLAGDDAAILAHLQKAADETNQILAREGLLAE